MAFDADVIVVAGGPAGVAVALGLRSAGVEVLVVERAAEGRDKPCGEGVLPPGVDALRRLGLRLPLASRPFLGIRYHAGGAVASGTFPSGRVGLGVRRRVLDAALWTLARERGVALRDQVRVTGLGGSAGRWCVRTDRGELRARLLVGADGARSSVRRWAGLHAEPRGRRRWALRRHFRLARGVEDPDRVEVELVSGGELYVTPVAPGLVNVAALCEDELAAGFRGDRDGALDRLIGSSVAVSSLLAGAAPEDDTLATGPLRVRAVGVVADGLVLVGDAAGFVDGITGEGTSLALRTAEVAAEVVASCVRRGAVDQGALSVYASRRAALVRRADLFAELIVGGLRHPALARRVVAGLARRPERFDRLLAAEVGEGTWSDLLALARAAA